MGTWLKKIKLKIFASKLQQEVGINLNSLTPADEIIFKITAFINSIKNNNSELFKNEYVCVDTVIMSCVYASYLISPYYVQEDLIRKCILSIRSLYNVPSEDLQKMWSNRIEYFSDYFCGLEDMSDVKSMVFEASHLFAYDITHNDYIEFTEDMPMLLLGFDKQIKIEMETAAYFNSVIPLIQETIVTRCPHICKYCGFRSTKFCYCPQCGELD